MFYKSDLDQLALNNDDDVDECDDDDDRVGVSIFADINWEFI